MLMKTKFRRKATRIAVSEIMIPIILIVVLGFTSVVLLVKVFSLTPEQLQESEERPEVKWIVNLGIVIAYSILDLILAYFVYSGIKERSYRKCHLWVTLQITVLALFTLALMKRCNTLAVSGLGIHFFEFIALAVSIYIYKIHHITFVYGLLDGLKSHQLPRRSKRSRTQSVDDHQDSHSPTPLTPSSSQAFPFEPVIRETSL